MSRAAFATFPLPDFQTLAAFGVADTRHRHRLPSGVPRRGPAPWRPAGRVLRLNPETDGRTAPDLFQRIDRADPALDRGWIIVRHHGSEKEAEAYLFGWDGFGPRRGAPRPPLRNAAGVFTAVHRRHVPSRLPNPFSCCAPAAPARPPTAT
jgi:hypothetical protein